MGRAAAAALVAGLVFGASRAAPAFAATAGADSAAARWGRDGRWSAGLVGVVGLAAPSDLNRRVEVANLALATDILPFAAYREVQGELRRGLSETLSLELRGGYLWREELSGRVTRRVSAMPIALGVTWYTHVTRRVRVGPTAAGGVLWGASFTGEDPLGGVDVSGTGPLAEAGGEVEYFLSRSFAVRLRGMARWAVVSGVLEDGGDIDLSGFQAQAALRAYFGP